MIKPSGCGQRRAERVGLAGAPSPTSASSMPPRNSAWGSTRHPDPDRHGNTSGLRAHRLRWRGARWSHQTRPAGPAGSLGGGFAWALRWFAPIPSGARSRRPLTEFVLPLGINDDPIAILPSRGQGSQSVGMLAELAEQHAVIKETPRGEPGAGLTCLPWLRQARPRILNKTWRTQPALLTRLRRGCGACGSDKAGQPSP